MSALLSFLLSGRFKEETHGRRRSGGRHQTGAAQRKVNRRGHAAKADRIEDSRGGRWEQYRIFKKETGQKRLLEKEAELKERDEGEEQV